MRHLNHKNDWYYELKPIFILTLGIFGLFAKPFFSLPLHSSIFSFLSSIMLLGAGSYIVHARKEYRKKSFMTT
ncbi:MAG: hypothetical protein ACK5V3_05700 [Bdellovibrionales bacterium]